MCVQLYCSLCLKPSKEYESLQSCEGDFNDIYLNTVKYFDPMLLTADEVAKKLPEKILVLCQNCWMPIKDFHEFQQNVFKARALSENINNVYVKPDLDAEYQKQQLTSDEDSNNDKDKEDDEYDKPLSYLKNNTINKSKILPLEEPETLITTEENRKPKQMNSEVITELKTIARDQYHSQKQKIQLNDKKDKGESTLNRKKCSESDILIAEWKPVLECDLCGETSSCFDKLRDHFKEKHKTRFFIKCCERKFNHRYMLVNHIQLHLNPEAHKCDTCHKLFSSKSTMNRHLRSHVTVENKFACQECGKAYVHEDQLKLHIQAVHNASRTCGQCGKTFHSRYDLENHLEKHAGIEKIKFRCDKCGTNFSSRSNMKRHKATVHHDGSTMYVCSICGKIMSNVNALLKHKINMHEKEPKYKCLYCDKAFKQSKRLQEHTATHTGKPLYQCPYCPRTFNGRAHMYDHRKKYHPVEYEEGRKNRLQAPKVDINHVKVQIVL